MPDPHEKKPEADEAEKEVLDSEKESQQTQAENYSSEVPEGNMFLTLLTAAGGAAYGPLKKRTDLINAVKHLNNPNFEYELLKVRDPVKFQKLQRDFELAKKEVEKQRKKSGGKRDYAQVGSGPIKRFTERISFDTFDHKEQAFKLASSVHTRINAQDVRGKIEATARVYNLSPENKTDLMRGIASWQKKNLGVSIDNYFQQTGQKLQYKEHPSKEKLLKRLKTEREKAKQLYGDLDKVRMESVKANRERIIAAQSQINDLLDPLKPIVSQEELKTRINKTLNPEPSPVTVTPPPPTISIPSSPLVKPPESIRNLNIPKSFKPTGMPKIQTIRNFRIPQAGKFFGKIGSISSLGSSLIQKGLFKLGGKLAVKAGIQAGLGAATGGIYNVASIVAGLLGIDLDKMVIYAALFVVAVPVGILILIIFGGSNISREFGAGLGNAETASMINNNTYAWKDFEKNVLGVQINPGTVPFGDSPFSNNKGEWVEFEDKFLVMSGRGPAL